MFNDRVRYRFLSPQEGEYFLQEDPIGWDDSPKTLERSLKSLSFITKYSDNIEFVKGSADWLIDFEEKYSPNGEVLLVREEKNPKTDIWELDYSEYLDIKTLKEKDNSVSIKILSGGLNDIIKNQMKEKFEFDREEDIEGNPISKLEYKKIGQTGRKLFRESVFQNKESVNVFDNYINPFSLDLNIVSESDDGFQSQINPTSNSINFSSNGNDIFFKNSQVFYKNSSEKKTIKFDFNFKALFNYNYSGDGNFGVYIGRELKLNEFSEYVGKHSESFIVRKIERSDPEGSQDIDIQRSFNLEIMPNEVLSVYIIFSSLVSNFEWSLLYNENDFSIIASEDSTFPPTQNNAILFHDCLERNIEIITGSKEHFLSDFFKTGPFKELLIASGKMIRSLPKLDEDRKPTDTMESMTASLNDLLTVKSFFNLGYGVERHNGTDKFVVEDLKHFFRNKVTINLGEISDFESYFADDLAWVGAEFGNAKAGEYEEIQGRFEHNSKNDYGFPTTGAKDKFDGTTKLRPDNIGAELERRKNYSVAPTEDTKSEKENFLFDAEEMNTGVYCVRDWRKDFAVEPKKLYDPDSAYNLRLSPWESMLRHGWLFASSLYKFSGEYIRYNSTTGYSEMITQKLGEIQRSHNGKILVSDLENARLSSKYINCSAKLTYDLKRQLNGSYKENGREIPNIYGLCEFTHRSNEKQYGWIMKVTQSRKAEFKIIKAIYNAK